MGYGSKSLNDWRDEVRANAVAHGFTDSPFPERLALIHSEVSEALEDYREGNKPQTVWYLDTNGARTSECGRPDVHGKWHPNKPCGIPSEIADVIIRCLDLCGEYGIDIEQAVREKTAYNETRPFKHGKRC